MHNGPCPHLQHDLSLVTLSFDLLKEKFVYICFDANWTSLQQPYEDQFKVETITVDRLKSAYLDIDCLV